MKEIRCEKHHVPVSTVYVCECVNVCVGAGICLQERCNRRSK